ncbi:MAG: L-aspartate oxidase, partial [Paracoccaceae bacterium]|nr:L-aspartate oxidase [Paracoccaceae bacterium]
GLSDAILIKDNHIAAAGGVAAVLTAATLIAAAALMRCESRGSHFRTDFPDADPQSARRSRLTLNQALALRAPI